MNYCENCGELVCSCSCVLEQESLEDRITPFRWEYALESCSEAGHTLFRKILPDCEE